MEALGKLIRKSFAYFLFFLTFLLTHAHGKRGGGMAHRALHGRGGGTLGRALVRGLRREAKKEQRGSRSSGSWRCCAWQIREMEA